MGAEFTSIELEVSANFDLSPLAEALDPSVGANYCGESYEGRPGTHFYAGSFSCLCGEDSEDGRAVPEVEKIEWSASSLCALIETLEPSIKRLWEDSIDRVFDIGLEANLDRGCIVRLLSPQTMRRMSELSLRLTVSVYSTDMDG